MSCYIIASLFYYVRGFISLITEQELMECLNIGLQCCRYHTVKANGVLNLIAH